MGAYEKKLEQRHADKRLVEKDMTQDQQQTGDAKPKNVLQRVTDLEKHIEEHAQDVPQTVAAVEQVLTEHKKQLDLLRETVSAISEMVGKEEVARLVVADRRVRADNMVTAEKQAVQKALEDGLLEKQEAVTEDSLIQAIELDPQGQLVEIKGFPAPTGYHQRVFGQYTQVIQDQIKGQGVGFKATTKQGHTLEIVGIYRDAPPKAESPAAQLTPEQRQEELAKVEAEIEGSLEPAGEPQPAQAGEAPAADLGQVGPQ